MKKRIFGILAALLLMVQVMPVMAEEIPEGTDDFGYTFDGANIDDGGTMTTAADGKTKVTVLFKVGCGHCQRVLEDIANSDWIHDEELADVCAIAMDVKGWPEESASVDDVKNFRDTYCSNANGRIQFGIHSRVRVAASRYAQTANLENPDGTFTTPIIAIVDEENKLRDVTSGSTDVTSTIKGKLEAIQSGNTQSPDPGNPDNPSTPDTPDNPDTPDTPDNPDTPDTPDNPDTPDTPDNPDTPDTPDTPDDGQNPGTPEQPDETPDSGSEKTACNHVGESNVISQATATSDAVVAVECVKCGTVFRYETVSNSAFASFLKGTANSILNAEQNGEVVVNTKIWTSFNKSVFEAMKARPDVKVTVNYVFEGNPYVLSIPAKANVDSFMDENGFGGFRYIEKVLSGK